MYSFLLFPLSPQVLEIKVKKQDIVNGSLQSRPVSATVCHQILNRFNVPRSLEQSFINFFANGAFPCEIQRFSNGLGSRLCFSFTLFSQLSESGVSTLVDLLFKQAAHVDADGYIMCQ